MNLVKLSATLSLLAVAISGCSVPGTIAQTGRLPEREAVVSNLPEPVVRFPKDEAPHSNLMEWWYYTGHLDAADQPAEYGFEMVVFQVLRAQLPPIYISHFAVSDITKGEIHFDQKVRNFPATFPPAANGGFAIDVDGWKMSGLNGRDSLEANLAGYGMKLDLSSRKPPALHNETGLIDYGAPGFSYYYSRTRMDAAGTLTVAGVDRKVTGEAWMDHQWGDFISLLGGGWDWFSFQLDDGSEIMLYEIRDQKTGVVAGRYGTRIGKDGKSVDIPESDFTTDVLERWKSPTTGTTYPSGWNVKIPSQGLSLNVTPRLRDQELVVKDGTGLTYWEGAVGLSGTQNGAPIAGRGYVELTGYDF